MNWHYLRICSTNGENIVFFASRIKSSMNPAMASFLELFKGKLLYINDTSFSCIRGNTTLAIQSILSFNDGEWQVNSNSFPLLTIIYLTQSILDLWPKIATKGNAKQLH